MPASDLVQMLTQAQAWFQAESQQPSQLVVMLSMTQHDSVFSAAVVTILPPQQYHALSPCWHPTALQAAHILTASMLIVRATGCNCWHSTSEVVHEVFT